MKQAVFFFVAALALSGCASAFQRLPPPVSFEAGGRDFLYLQGAPAVPQRSYQCGPASLASVMRYWGFYIQADAIAKDLSKRGALGTLNFTLGSYMRDKGFWSQILYQDSEQLKQWLFKRIPVIVMLRSGPFGLNHHSVVVTGFDEGRKVYWVNAGYPQVRAMAYQLFEKRWKAAHGWTLIATPPERVDWELPAQEARELALMLERAGRWAPAERWYRWALEQQPKSIEARFNLANVLYRTGRISEAQKIYLELIEEKPGWGPASNNLAWIYLEQGRAPRAIQVLEASLQHGAQRQHDLLDTLGVAYFRLNQLEKARQVLVEALERVPPDRPEDLRQIREHLKGLSPVAAEPKVVLELADGSQGSSSSILRRHDRFHPRLRKRHQAVRA